MRKKMTRQDLQALFPHYEPGGNKPEHATQKGFVHKHRPAYKAPKAEMSPAKWKKMMRERRLKREHSTTKQ